MSHSEYDLILATGERHDVYAARALATLLNEPRELVAS